MKYVMEKGKMKEIAEEKPIVEVRRTARETLQEAMQEAWTSLELREVRRSLKSVGQNVVAPAYDQTAADIGLSDAYKKTAKRIGLDKAYEEVWE